MPTITQPTFSRGEVTPDIYGRIDISSYYTALKQAVNFNIMRYGGVENRAGLRYINNAVSQSVRLIPFIFNQEQSYVVEFGDKVARFYYRGGAISSGGSVYQIETPYPPEALKDIYYAQSFDVLFLVHPEYPIHVLKRYENDNWVIEPYELINGPFEDVNADKDITVYIDTTDANDPSLPITIYAIDQNGQPASIFDIRDVGTLFYIQQKDYSDTKPWVAHSSAPLQSLRHSDLKVYKCVEHPVDDASKVLTGTIQPIHDEGIEWDGDGQDPKDDAEEFYYGVAWEYQHSGYAIFRITSVNAGQNSAIGTIVSGQIPKALLGVEHATYKWAHGAFSPKNGYPSTISFFQQRLVLGGTINQPQTIWFSKTGIFNDFGTSTPGLDDDSISFTLASREANSVVGLIPLSALMILTEGAEWAVFAQDGVLTATTLNARIQSYRGSKRIQPLAIGDSALFIQAKGKAIRELNYRYESDNYSGNELNILSHHIFDKNSVIDMAYSQIPDSITYFVLEDGTCAQMTYFNEQEVLGFSRFVTNGRIESVCSIPEDNVDAVYFSVRRNNGLFIERLSERDKDNPTFLDSHLTYSGNPVTSVSGLNHLNNQTVKALCNGSTIIERVVSGGSISLGGSYSNVVVGLQYESLMQTLPLASEQQSTVSTNKKSVPNIYFRCLDTGFIDIGCRYEDLIQYKRPIEDNNMLLVSGLYEIKLRDNFKYDAGIFISQRDPLPTKILDVFTGVSIGG